jgi:hypothetical protein
MIFWLLLALLMQTAAHTQPAVKRDDCGLDAYRPCNPWSGFSRQVRKTAEPEYPADAVAKRIGGTVRIWAVVDREGRVVRTCPYFEKNKPRPEQSIVDAAEAAAKLWIYKQDFGLRHTDLPQCTYMKTMMVFKFDPTRGAHRTTTRAQCESGQ